MAYKINASGQIYDDTDPKYDKMGNLLNVQKKTEPVYVGATQQVYTPPIMGNKTPVVGGVSLPEFKGGTATTPKTTTPASTPVYKPPTNPVAPVSQPTNYQSVIKSLIASGQTSLDAFRAALTAKGIEPTAQMNAEFIASRPTDTIYKPPTGETTPTTPPAIATPSETTSASPTETYGLDYSKYITGRDLSKVAPELMTDEELTYVDQTNPTVQAEIAKRRKEKSTLLGQQSEKSYLEQQARDEEGKIQSQLEREKQAISAKYALKRQQAETDTENEFKSNLANLYSMGVVNPASSGNASIGAASAKYLSERKAAIDAAEQEELARAEDKAMGLTTTAKSTARQNLLDLEARIKNEQATSRQNLLDKVEAVKTGRTFAKEDKDSAIADFTNQLALGGTGAFEGYKSEDYEALSKLTGYNVQNLITKIKQKELQGGGTLEKDNQGGFYWLEQDANGNYTGKYTTIKSSNAETAITTAGGRQLLINKDTGETIKDLGNAYKGGTGTKTGFDEKTELSNANEAAFSVVGEDGYISPQDYLKLRNAFVERGGSPTVFDTKMKGFRNPYNTDYPIGK